MTLTSKKRVQSASGIVEEILRAEDADVVDEDVDGGLGRAPAPRSPAAVPTSAATPRTVAPGTARRSAASARSTASGCGR